MRILVVEDDLRTARMVEFLLGEENYAVVLVDNPDGALALIERQAPDLLILDINLSRKGNGFDLYRQLKALGHDLPVIFVTAKGEVDDRVTGLNLGADDYITKPFEPAELLARVQAVLRRYRKSAPGGNQIVKGGGFEISPVDMRVTLPNRHSLIVTPTEMKMLLHLLERAGQVVTREELLASVWSTEAGHDGRDSNVVDVYIRRLRRKIEPDPSTPQYLLSTRGLGYRFVGKHADVANQPTA
ncbi:MAG TPA: response regulator transcription factor [Ktedonobacterales bacterium]|jgi:DNA-binding response OmpR family regulator